MVTFFSTHCPKCAVLEMKLKKAGVMYTENNDVKEMMSYGLKSAPALKLEDGTVLDFSAAVQWLKTVKEGD